MRGFREVSRINQHIIMAYVRAAIIVVTERLNWTTKNYRYAEKCLVSYKKERMKKLPGEEENRGNEGGLQCKAKIISLKSNPNVGRKHDLAPNCCSRWLFGARTLHARTKTNYSRGEGSNHSQTHFGGKIGTFTKNLIGKTSARHLVFASYGRNNGNGNTDSLLE